MHKLPLFAAAALLGGVAIAAAQPAPPPAPPAPSAQDGSPEPMRDRMRGGERGMMEGMMARRMMGAMRGPSGAHFRFEREGAMIDLRCAENESTRACVDAAGVLLDKLAPQPAR